MPHAFMAFSLPAPAAADPHADPPDFPLPPRPFPPPLPFPVPPPLPFPLSPAAVPEGIPEGTAAVTPMASCAVQPSQTQRHTAINRWRRVWADGVAPEEC